MNEVARQINALREGLKREQERKEAAAAAFAEADAECSREETAANRGPGVPDL